MSRFYGSIEGNRGEATRGGSIKSGIEGHIRGWQIGARVYCYVNEQGNDEVKVVITGGSYNPNAKLLLGRYTLRDTEVIKVSD